MRMRQSLAELEKAFVEEMELDRDRREAMVRQTELRSRKRAIERVHRRSSIRFFLLVLVLLATAALVTVAMFETLYYVMG